MSPLPATGRTRLRSDNRITAGQVKHELQMHSSREKAALLARFFKTGRGEYGEGDVFLGVTVPVQRRIAARYRALSQKHILKLLAEPFHECRLTALFILVLQYSKADEHAKQEIFKFYLRHTERINNWDLVDSSAPYIVGPYLLDKDKSILFKLAKSPRVWNRRIAILATSAFIRGNDYATTFRLAEMLMQDKHDLIHKALGWMLREIGKRDLEEEEAFLQVHCSSMPRTTLRYAIEKFDERTRRRYLSAKTKVPRPGMT